MSNQADTRRLTEALANIATSIVEIIEVRIREKAAGERAAGSVHGGINMLTLAERWVGKKEAAGHLKISLRTLSNWMNKGVIPHIRIGRGVRFKLSEVDEAVKRRLGIVTRY
jgi:excisionase family DNA binding protein